MRWRRLHAACGLAIALVAGGVAAGEALDAAPRSGVVGS